MVRLEREVLKNSRSMLDETLCSISQILNSDSVPFDVKLQVKNYYGLYKRLKTYQEPNKVHDLFQIKFLLNDISSCYKLRDNIQSLYHVLQDKSKDYIESPKTNMYRALHTSCDINHKSIVQFQMVTPSLDLVNTHGITAHWNQSKKETSIESMQNDFMGLQAFQILNEIVSSNMDIKTFNDDIRTDVLGKKVYVITPKGETIELPVGATPIDFAYYIHTYLGDHYVLAKVNGNIVDGNYELKNKDVVEIIYSDTIKPEPEKLLKLTTTSHAKRCIKGIKRRELKRIVK
jgi:GTP pyrophosphokinase